MSTSYKFQGWLGQDKNAVGNMRWGEYEPKPFNDEDVDIEVRSSHPSVKNSSKSGKLIFLMIRSAIVASVAVICILCAPAGMLLKALVL